MLNAELKSITKKRRLTTKRVKIRDMKEADQIETLASKEKLFLDIIRMICYRTETRMIPLVDQILGNSDPSRNLLKSLRCRHDP